MLPPIDNERFRSNVAALITCQGRFLACERADVPGSLQSVQGGLEDDDPSPEEAILREIQEELGVSREHVRVVARSRSWRRYRFPEGVRKRTDRPDNAGQEQLWFEVELDSPDAISLARACGEFSRVELVTAQELVLGFVGWKRAVVIDFLLERGHLSLDEVRKLWERVSQ